MNILLPSLIHSINSINYVRQLSRSEEQAGISARRRYRLRLINSGHGSIMNVN